MNCKYFIFGFALCFTCNSYAQDNTWFSDVTTKIGLTGLTGSRLYVADVNGDDYPDLVVQADSTLHLYVNTQDPSSSDPHDRIFVDQTSSSGINAPSDTMQTLRQTAVAALADVDNDGDVDITACNLYYTDQVDKGDRCEVLLNDGKGHFTLKENNGLHELGPISASTMSFLDYDKDGKIDLFVGTHYDSWNTQNADGNHLMKGNGDGTFTDVSAPSGISSSQQLPLYGSNVTDWNNDCLPDIITAPYLISGNSNLWKDNGNGTFTDVAQEANANPHWLPGDNQPAVPWEYMPYDYDNDGDMDFLLVLVHGGNSPGMARTTIVTNQGLANGYHLLPELNRIVRKNPQSYSHGDHCGRWFDMDNDGLVDLGIAESHYLPATDRLYLCKQDNTHIFTDITPQLFTSKIKSPDAIEVIDFDRDGNDDLLINLSMEGEQLLLLKNNIGAQNHHLTIKLDPPKDVNKSAVGTKIRVVTGTTAQLREIHVGEGNFGGQQPLIINFGMANYTVADTVSIEWPDAACSTTLLKNVPADQMITVSKNGVDSEKMFVPNAFSPNADGVNDQLVIGYSVNDNCVQNFSFRIYDRWGELVFQTNDPLVHWDGKYNNTYLSSGVYMYLLSATICTTGKSINQKGNVSLIK